MKRLGVFLLPPEWDTSLSQGYPQHHQNRRYPFIHLGETGTVRVKCHAQEHDIMSPARARTRIVRSEGERTITMRPPATILVVIRRHLEIQFITVIFFSLLGNGVKMTSKRCSLLLLLVVINFNNVFYYIAVSHKDWELPNSRI